MALGEFWSQGAGGGCRSTLRTPVVLDEGSGLGHS